jgi:hypothetical protein
MNETAAGRHARPGDPGHDGDRGGDVAREAVLARAFVRLADTLASDFDIVDFLHGLAADSVEILEAEAAGVMLADPRGGLRLIASSAWIHRQFRPELGNLATKVPSDLG